ncbi:hypothetical protein ABEF95_006361 [Exophiala dermatitidis]
MAWYSILPSHLTTYETWIIRGFLLLAIINISPWILAILYDLFYYLGRIVWHEVPIWGGRARGEHRPRAPSLRDRDGHNRRRSKRGLSFADIIGAGGGQVNTREEGRRGEGDGPGEEEAVVVHGESVDAANHDLGDTEFRHRKSATVSSSLSGGRGGQGRYEREENEED